MSTPHSDRSESCHNGSGTRRTNLLKTIENVSFSLTAYYFQLACFHFASNQELITKLHGVTHKPCSLMERGVDLSMFNPTRRDRGEDGQFVIGYVGRLTAEKKVRNFAELARAVKAAGYDHVKFVFVGQGGEEQWLREHVPDAEMTGVLRGEALGRAYANMNLFAFYSETDTFGNVVLEALASGVPAVVTDKGGPKFIVEHERSGFICTSDEEFTSSVLRLVSSNSLQRDMAVAARQRAERASWDTVFDSVYEAYRRELPRISEDGRGSRIGQTGKRLRLRLFYTGLSESLRRVRQLAFGSVRQHSYPLVGNDPISTKPMP